MADRRHLEALTKQLADDGRLIEAGWVSLRLACDLIDAPADQLEAMRNSFFAGAQHLLGSIMTFLEGDDEATEADVRRLTAIATELDGFIADFTLRNIRPGGSA